MLLSIHIIIMEGRNRNFFKLLLGERTYWGKRGLKLKLSSARSYWGGWAVSNFSMCPVGKPFPTKEMVKNTKNDNITSPNFFCQSAAMTQNSGRKEEGKVPFPSRCQEKEEEKGSAP